MKRAERELLCQECEREYAIWYCDHFLWNPVAERLEEEFKAPVHFLCLNCFALNASRIVTEGQPDARVMWKLDVGSPADAATFFRATEVNHSLPPETPDSRDGGGIKHR